MAYLTMKRPDGERVCRANPLNIKEFLRNGLAIAASLCIGSAEAALLHPTIRNKTNTVAIFMTDTSTSL